MSHSVDIALVRRALRLPLPGPAAQAAMAPRPRAAGVDPPQEYRDGAVLLLLYPRDGALHIVLTRRCDHLAAHAGQVSLPGGACEAGDTCLADTALREAQEELGLEVRTLELLGRLSPVEIPVSGYRVHPWVACSPERPSFRPDPNEVAELLEVPLAQLLDPATVAEEEWLIRGHRVQVPFYRLCGHKVWGATAAVLAEFIALLRMAGATAP